MRSSGDVQAPIPRAVVAGVSIALAAVSVVLASFIGGAAAAWNRADAAGVISCTSGAFSFFLVWLSTAALLRALFRPARRDQD